MNLPCCYPSLQSYDILKQKLDSARLEDEDVHEYAETLVRDLRERINAQIRLETLGAIVVKVRLSQEARSVEGCLRRIQRRLDSLTEGLSRLTL